MNDLSSRDTAPRYSRVHLIQMRQVQHGSLDPGRFLAVMWVFVYLHRSRWWGHYLARKMATDSVRWAFFIGGSRYD